MALIRKAYKKAKNMYKIAKFATSDDRRMKVLSDTVEYYLSSGKDTSYVEPSVKTTLNTYQRLLWVFKGIHESASQAASVPLTIKKLIGPEESEIDRLHPVNELKTNPNRLLTEQELKERTFAYRKLAGEAFWFIDREKPGGLPVKIHAPRPDAVSPAKKEHDIAVFSYNGKQYKMKDVIHFRQFNPLSSFRGLSSIAPLEDSLILELYEITYGQTWYANAVNPSMLFSTEDEVTDDEYERFLAAMRRLHQGVEKSGRIDLIQSGIEPMEFNIKNPTEGEYIEIKELDRDEILTGLGCYHLAASLRGENNLKDYERMFWRSLVPELTNVQQRITKELIRQYPKSEDCYAEFDLRQVSGLRPDLLDESLAYYRLWQSGVMTANEIRNRIGLSGKVEWGDNPPPAIPFARTSHLPNEQREHAEGLQPHTERYVDSIAENVADRMVSENGDLDKSVAKTIVRDEFRRYLNGRTVTEESYI